MITTAIVAWCTLLALAPPRRPFAVGAMSFLFGFVLNELPFVAFAYLLVSTWLGLGGSGVDSPSGRAVVSLAVFTTAGLAVIAWRGLRAGPAVRTALAEGLGAEWPAALDAGMAARLRRHLPLARILFGPFFFRRRDVERLASQGWVCISANYRLRPAAQFPDHLIDVKKVIAWAREHAHEYGADPAMVFIAGSSSGGQLAALAALTPNDPVYQPGFEHADTSVTAAICLHGYYGHSGGQQQSPSSPLAYGVTAAPPFFLAHGDQDSLIPVETARLFATKLRATSSNPVVYAELPGAQHGFDRFHSLRFEQVVDAIEAFTAWIRSRQQAGSIVVPDPATRRNPPLT